MADADIRRRVRRAVRDDEVLLERVVKLSGGNPFAAVELARTAGAADDRISPMGALVLRGLGREATAALTRVAVLGAAFDTDEYVALSGAGQERAYALLDETLATGAVERTGPGYRFRHSLVRDALLDGLPPHRLLPLHRHAAKALRDLEASPARIGHQLLQAGDVRAATVSPAGCSCRRGHRRVPRHAGADRRRARRRPRPERRPMLRYARTCCSPPETLGLSWPTGRLSARHATRPSGGGCCRGSPEPRCSLPTT